MHPLSHLCERARTWASLLADGELSELEAALLRAHLDGCADCRAFARGVDAVVVTLRAARLERPAARVLVSPPKRRSAVRALQALAAATLVIGAGVVAAVTGPGHPSAVAKPVAMVAAVDSPDRLRELRRPGLIDQGRTIPRNRPDPSQAV